MYFELWQIIIFIILFGLWSELRYFDGKYLTKNYFKELYGEVYYEEYLNKMTGLIRESKIVGAQQMIEYLIENKLIVFDKNDELIGYEGRKCNIDRLKVDSD